MIVSEERAISASKQAYVEMLKPYEQQGKVDNDAALKDRVYRITERLIAQAGSRDYGILSVLMQTWFRIDRVVKVPPKAFSPPPKVDSVVLSLVPLSEPRIEVHDAALFRQLVRGAFAQRRKTLRNSLLGAGWQAEQIDRAFAAADIDCRRRGETLTPEEFAGLANVFATDETGV